MSTINKVMLLGRLGKDPETRELGDSGNSVTYFSLATSRKAKEKETVTWHNITAFGKQGEILSKYLKKGSQIFIEGRIDNYSYEKDGETKYKNQVIVESFSFVGDSKKSSSNNQEDFPDFGEESDEIPF
jgi:single-strand DNA-binding protein